ncbi:MAG: hypothetical protein OMM_00995 [Candidatus Magnetoglobus multicellularis str. Araruama]|uniref:Dystroglycan-type cadherin-like domain-containing protein n=1 Tax=Candidatus Magnetoglobus multicellularis str. Araruama TaxID=890399 RepID=A0A1V1PF48_9BACT|nr:MAG: hypothetical protein OMM_00995 [Candidatus Magnetoglobus multicellularis str. Araruama]
MKSIPKIFIWICLIIWLCHPPLFCADIDQVTGLHSISHVSHQVSSNTQITIVWKEPVTGQHNITGYYYQFNGNSAHVFTMDNTSWGQAIYVPKDAPRVAVSTDYSGLDDEPIYCHVAAVDEKQEIIGPTQTAGPYRIDNIAPFPATVIAPAITADSVIALRMGAHHASEMNISSHAYCRGLWEPFQQVKTWQLDDYVGTQILYVCFKDAAGNISQTQAAVWYDSVRANVDLQAAYTKTTQPDPIPVTITFDEKIINFHPADIQMENGLLANFTFQPDDDGYASVFTMTVEPGGQGPVRIKVSENSANDLAQNGNIQAETLTIIYDRTDPTVSLSSDEPMFTHSAGIPVTITFSEPVDGFSGQIKVFNAIPDQFKAVGSSAPYSVYTFILKPASQGFFSAQIEAKKAFDRVGNGNIASSMIAFNYDTTLPNATILASDTDPVSSPLSVTIVFDEYCRLTSLDAIEITNATLTHLSTENTYYTQLSFQLIPNLPGAIDVFLNTNAFYDQAKNKNSVPVSRSFTFDSGNPTVIIGSDIQSPTHLPVIPVWIAFNKPVDQFSSESIGLSNAHITEFKPVSASKYEMNISFDSPGPTKILIPQGVAQDVSGHTNFPSALFEITYKPNTPHMVLPVNKAFCLEDHTAGPVSIGISDAEGGEYTVFVQTADLLSVDSNHLTLCMTDTCQAMPFQGLTLSAHELKILQLFVNPLPNANGNTRLTITVRDNLYAVSQSLALGITPINDPPVIGIQKNPIIYTENDMPTIIAQSASVTDIDSPNFANGQLIVDFVQPNAENLLRIKSQGTDPGTISVTLEEIFWGNQKFASFSGGTGTSPLLINIENTVADAAAIAELIQCITYENMSERPLSGSFDIRFQLLDGDGGISIPQTNLMTIIPVNDPPEITLSTKTVAYTENQDPVHVSEYARVEDLDAINFQSAVLQIEIIANGTSFDRLVIKDQGDDYGKIGINGVDVKHSGKRVGQWSGGTHYQNPLVVIFNDLATEISIYKVIQAVTFETISDMPSTNERTIQIILTEADGTASETLIRKISVASDNDSPAHHLPFSVVTDEDTPFVFTQNRGIFVTDPDVLDNQLKTTITINDGGTFSLGQTDNLDFLSGDGYRDVLVVTYAKLSDLNQALDGLTFYPTPNFSGTTGITFRTSDQGFTGSGGIPKKADDTILIEVKPVPDPPSISDPGTVIFQEDTSASTSLYLTDVDGGIVTIAVASAYTPLIPSSHISLTGTDLAQIDGGYTILTENNTIHPLSMHIMPSDNQYGETHIILMLTDTDGMAFTRTISVNVLPVNDMPTISAIESQSTIEDIPSAPIPFSVTDLESTSEAFSFSVEISEPLKISQITINGQGITRTLQVYPAHDAVGPVQITVTVWDHQEGAASTSFEMELVPVNDIPVIYLEDHSYGQEDQVTIISWSIIDVDGDNLAISAISTNEFLVPDENIILDGANVQPDNGSFKVQTIAGQPAYLSIVVTPLENKYGDANLIFSISDAGGMPLIAKSLLHITPVNDPPTIAPISNQMADEDQFTPSIPIQMSDIDDATMNLSLTAQSSNVTLVSDDDFLFEGQGDTSRLSITPKADQNGSATITVMVHDPDGLTAVTHFGLTVKPVNDAPTISPIDDQITAINILIDPIPFTIDDLETPASGLTLTALPSVPIEINFSGTGNDRLLHIINPQNYIGLINIDIVVSDNNLINSTSFTLTITEHNDPPEIQGLSDQTIQEDTELENYHFQISDIQSSASDLIVTIESMNENLVPNENITLSGVGISRYLSIRPVRNQSGNAIISITVKDPSGLKTQDTFTLTVIAENDPPILSLIPPAACGNSFSLFHDLAGRAFAFGLNHLGQLGIGEPDNQFSPVSVMNNVQQMFAGELHAAAVTSDGTVYVWGNNDFSQLGIASVVSADTPQCLESLNNIQSLALGYHHSMALDQDGKLWAWGTNTFGQTGIDSLEPVETPMPLIHDSDNQTLPLMIAIDAGKFHSVALDHFGILWTWGYNDWGQLGNGTFTKHTRPERVLDANGGFFRGWWPSLRAKILFWH